MRYIWANYESGSLKKCLRWGEALMKLALSDKSQMAALSKYKAFARADLLPIER